MTNDEIKVLIADCEDEYHLLGRNTGLNVPKLRTALETLLAREAEVMEYMQEMAPNSHALRKIRAILYPQPAALAEETTNAQ